ncbi:MAG TPA: XdhC family protein [Pyrinomonadaceae bacterium]|nr:XdhC family protein [Pyrinomonadaceae bacterium]
MKELEIWKFAAERLRRNESVMLLVVAESEGSSPGRRGFKMIVAGDDLRGSIGGGVMEVSLAELAKLRITNYELRIKTEIIEQVHRKNAADSSGMICSGRQTVIFFELNSEHLKLVREIIGCLENHQSCRLQITNYKFQITEKPSKIGTQNDDFRFERFNENEFVYEENLGFKNKLFIIGGGHCALALSELMAKMDFHISLFDDRADLNTIEKNKFVHEKKIIESYEQIGEFIESSWNCFVVVMTLGYKFDEIVIRQLFDKNFKYFGVLGSKAKMKTLLKTLEKEGFDKEKLKQIKTPIGLPINSHTPEEIAVSIAAEIIAVKNAKEHIGISEK